MWYAEVPLLIQDAAAGTVPGQAKSKSWALPFVFIVVSAVIAAVTMYTYRYACIGVTWAIRMSSCTTMRAGGVGNEMWRNASTVSR